MRQTPAWPLAVPLLAVGALLSAAPDPAGPTLCSIPWGSQACPSKHLLQM